MRPKLTLTEYTDPLSGWAWGSEPKLRLLQWRYGHLVRWRRVMAGIIGEGTNNRPYPEGASLAWANVSRHTRMPFAENQRWCETSSMLACRAVKAAELQGRKIAARVLRCIREAAFLDGRPLMDADEICAVLTSVPGLDLRNFREDLHSDVSAALFREDWAEVRRPSAFVRTLVEIGEGNGIALPCEAGKRYSVPTVLVAGAGKEITVAGWKPFEDYEEALAEVHEGSLAQRPDPTPAEALTYFGTLTAAELEMLCGVEARLPESTTRIWGDEAVFFAPGHLAIERFREQGVPQ
jgi:putative protein-disulfide isomerase